MRDIVGVNGTCIERECTVKINGKAFEYGGAFIGIDPKTGHHGGVIYGDYNKKQVTNWHGDVTIPARYGISYRGNMGDERCHLWFTWKGIKFHGVWCGMEWSQIIRVKEIKS
jgi:hypothetical protein